MSDKRELQVKRLSDGYIAERHDVTGWSERRIERTIGGMLINADTDRWVVYDTDWDDHDDVPAPGGTE